MTSPQKLYFMGWLLSALLLAACGNEPLSSTGQPATAGSGAVAAVPSLPAITPTPTINPNLPLLSNPVFRLQNTSYTKNMGSDGYSWAQGYPIQVDSYNKIFTIAQQDTTGDHKFVFSNDGGFTWSENATEERYLSRGTAAYDSHSDKIHVLWSAANPQDGIIYRRYDITRDSSNNITAITRDKSINLQLDFQTNSAISMDYQHPVLFWLNDKEFGSNGTLVAIWGAHSNNSSPITNEIRVSRRSLSNSAEDGLAANWKAITAGDTPLANDASALPKVAYSPVFSNSGQNSNTPYVSAMYKTSGKHSKDLYFFYANGNDTWEWRRAIWNGSAGDWSGGLTGPVVITKINRSGNDTGYNLKQQLGSKPVEDLVNDRVYFGFATWKDNALGDSWSYVYVDANDNLSPLVDVYSAGGAHSYAPTGDIVFDKITGRLISAYVKTAGGGTFARAYDGVNPTGPEILIFNSSEVDIPLLWQGGRYKDHNTPKLLVLFRNTTRPYGGYFGTLDWVEPGG